MTTTHSTVSTVHIKTTRFGALEVAEDLIITLPEGLIGFEDCTRFVVLHQDEKSPFRWLQSLDDGQVSFPIMDPWQFRSDYAPTLTDADAEELGLTPEMPGMVFVIVTVPLNNPRGMTANLLSPIVINPLTRRAKQVIVLDDCYTTKHNILEEMARTAKREA